MLVIPCKVENCPSFWRYSLSVEALPAPGIPPSPQQVPVLPGPAGSTSNDVPLLADTLYLHQGWAWEDGGTMHGLRSNQSPKRWVAQRLGWSPEAHSWGCTEGEKLVPPGYLCLG